MTTFTAKPHEVRRDWFVVDATDKVLGRLAVEIARACAASTSPSTRRTSTPATTSWCVNATSCASPGRRRSDKNYYRHTRYPGGINETNFAKLQARFPDRVLEKAVKGMLPEGAARLRDAAQAEDLRRRRASARRAATEGLEI